MAAKSGSETFHRSHSLKPPNCTKRGLPEISRHLPHYPHLYDTITPYHSSHLFLPLLSPSITRMPPCITTTLLPPTKPKEHTKSHPHTFTYPNCPPPSTNCRHTTHEPHLLISEPPCLTPLVPPTCNPPSQNKKFNPHPQHP